VCRFAHSALVHAVNTEDKNLSAEQKSQEALQGPALPAWGALAKAFCG
jgi:hypothetical protein